MLLLHLPASLCWGASRSGSNTTPKYLVSVNCICLLFARQFIEFTKAVFTLQYIIVPTMKLGRFAVHVVVVQVDFDLLLHLFFAIYETNVFIGFA